MHESPALHPFALSDDEVALRHLAREFAQRSLAPEAGHFDAAGAVPAALLKRLRGLGLTAVCAPEDAGGAGLSLRALAVVCEALGAASASAATLIGHQAGPAVAALHALDEAGAKVLAQAAEGTPVAWLGQGAETFDAVVGAAEAKALVGLQATDEGLAVVVFTPDQVRCTPLNPTPLALRAAGLCQVKVEGKPSILLAISQTQAAAILDAARVVDAAVALGVGTAALDEAVRYALDRKQFGQAIAEFQAVQWMLADSATELDAARLLLWGAAAGDGPVGPALRLASEAALRTADRALQIHGGYGYTREYPVERLFRDAHHAALTA